MANKIKLYAKTLNPEWYDYRIYDISEDEYNQVIIDGGRDYADIDNKGYLKAIKALNNEYGSWSFEDYYKGSIMDFLRDLLPKKENGKAIHPKEAQIIHQALERENTQEIICVCLRVITGVEFKHKGLRGCCQGDYADCYYPITCSKEYIDYVEAWYFGTGTEVEVDETERTYVDNPDDIEGWTFYTALWRIKDIKREVRSQCGYKPDDEDIEVVLWKYEGTHTIKQDYYKLADE